MRGVASHTVKSRVIGLHSSGAVKVNIGSWSRVMAWQKGYRVQWAKHVWVANPDSLPVQRGHPCNGSGQHIGPNGHWSNLTGLGWGQRPSYCRAAYQRQGHVKKQLQSHGIRYEPFFECNQALGQMSMCQGHDHI